MRDHRPAYSDPVDDMPRDPLADPDPAAASRVNAPGGMILGVLLSLVIIAAAAVAWFH